MAKIGNLQVTKIKIVNGALTSFYGTTSTGGAALSLIVPIASNNPTLVFAWCLSNACSVTRVRGSKLIGSGAGVPPSGVTAFVCFDDDPIDGDTYRLTGQLSSSTNRLAAAVKLK